MRVGIVALIQESNTFIARKTALKHFEQDLLATGEAVRLHLAGAHHEVGGFFAGLAEENIEAVPIFAARAMPYGVIEAAAFDRLLEMMFRSLARAAPLDGVLAAAHGATVSEFEADADGAWLSRLREAVGPDTPVIATLDPHANVSLRMVEATDALIAYRTNPHLDQRDRGIEAARLMGQTLRGETRPTQAAVMPPIAIDVQCQQTDRSPCEGWTALADEIRRRPGVLSCSPILGFPYADVPEMGSAAIVVTDDDPALAQRSAQELALHLWGARENFCGQWLDTETALDRVAGLKGRICLLDMGDNVGGGSPGDGTELAHAIHKRALGDSFACLCDPQAVEQAWQYPAGTELLLAMGGKTDDLHGRPLEAHCTVLSHCDGIFEEGQPRHGGFTRFDQGPTTVVRTDHGLTVMLTSRRMPPWSLAQLRACGLDPGSFRLLVAKGVNAPVAAYREVCQHFLHVNTSGVTCADLLRLDYLRRRQPMFPFERETAYE